MLTWLSKILVLGPKHYVFASVVFCILEFTFDVPNTSRLSAAMVFFSNIQSISVEQGSANCGIQCLII